MTDGKKQNSKPITRPNVGQLETRKKTEEALEQAEGKKKRKEKMPRAG